MRRVSADVVHRLRTTDYTQCSLLPKQGFTWNVALSSTQATRVVDRPLPRQVVAGLVSLRKQRSWIIAKAAEISAWLRRKAGKPFVLSRRAAEEVEVDDSSRCDVQHRMEDGRGMHGVRADEAQPRRPRTFVLDITRIRSCAFRQADQWTSRTCSRVKPEGTHPRVASGPR